MTRQSMKLFIEMLEDTNMITNSNHTTGPWTAHGIYVSKDGYDYEYPIASVSTTIPDDEAWADAALIAAAPDLLAALAGLLTSIESMIVDDNVPAYSGDKARIAAARAAIEKA